MCITTMMTMMSELVDARGKSKGRLGFTFVLGGFLVFLNGRDGGIGWVIDLSE